MAVSLEILVEGAPYTGRLDFRSTHGFDKLSGMVEMRIAPEPGVPMPIKMGQDFEAILGGQPILTGHAHEIVGDDDWDSDWRMVHARDRTQDFIDSTIGPLAPLKPPATLKQILDYTLAGMGLEDIEVIDNVAPDPFASGEVPSPAIDEFGHSFADRLAQARQVLLATDGKGNIVITRNEGQARLGNAMLFRGGWTPGQGPSTSSGNIKKARFRASDLNRSNLYAVSSQPSPNDREYWESKDKDFRPGQAGPMSKDYGVAHDDHVRTKRRKHIRAEYAIQKGKTRGAAAWRSSVAKARGFQYVATVQGFEAEPGRVWWPGYIVPVSDWKYDLEAELLLVEVRFHQTWNGATTTELTFTVKDAYSDKEASGDPRDDRTEKPGIGAPDPEPEAEADDLLRDPVVEE